MADVKPTWRTVPGLSLVLGSFALNGALYGSLLSRYAEIANTVDASEAAFGVALTVAAIGGLVGSVLAPALVRVVRDVGAVTLFGCAFALLAVGVAMAPNLVFLSAALFAMTLVDGGQDVSMNTLAVRVQQHAGQSVMGRAHATWSFSLSAGTALGAVAAWLGVPVSVHIGLSVVVAIAVQLGAWRRSRDQLPAAVAPQRVAAVADPSRRVRLPRGRARVLLVVLGVAAIAASYVESPGQEWTGLLLNRGFDASPGLAATGPLVFSIGLLASRLLLDPLTRKLPVATIARAAGATIVVTMLAALLIAASTGSTWQALAMLGVAGVGAGPIFPLLFGAAEILSSRYGVTPATTTSTVSALSRIGAITAPVAIGALTSVTSLSVVFAVMAAGGLVIAATLPPALRKETPREPGL
jgi:MFS family permease